MKVHYFDLFDASCDGMVLPVGQAGELAIGLGAESPSFRSIWWRLKPPERIVTNDIVDLYDQQFAFNEWAAVVGFAAEQYRECFWMNRREAERIASNKLHQLAVAQDLGFNVPRTRFTNSLTAVREFMCATDRYLVKTFLPYLSPDMRQCHAREVTLSQLEALGANIGQCPMILQNLIEPEYELRVTIIGKVVFAVRINARRAEHPDWRLETNDDIFTRVSLDAVLEDRLVELNAAFGLEFGCYDLIRGKDGNLYFLEVNPAGQWLWLEERLGLRISDEVARRLVAGC